MFFNLFGKKEKAGSTTTFHDITYAHTAAKMKACLELAKQDSNVIFIAWFADTLHEFKTYFTEHGVDESRVREYRTVTGAQLQNITPVFIEHYPLHTKEMELTANWTVKDITVYNALDEALFTFFGGDKIISLLEKLGIKEDEALEHSMISRSIINAQEKIAKKVAIEQSARSQKEWMEKNAG